MCLARSGAVPHLQKLGRVFMQDGARCHTANSVKYYLARKGIKNIEDWPAHSPDMNPIEELWGYLERLRSEQFGPARTVEELKRQLKVVWDLIPLKTINNFVASFEAKLKRVRSQGGPRSDAVYCTLPGSATYLRQSLWTCLFDPPLGSRLAVPKCGRFFSPYLSFLGGKKNSGRAVHRYFTL